MLTGLNDGEKVVVMKGGGVVGDWYGTARSDALFFPPLRRNCHFILSLIHHLPNQRIETILLKRISVLSRANAMVFTASGKKGV